ncbi:hypothetical protein ACUOI2_23030, partial [Escherichia coli]
DGFAFDITPEVVEILTTDALDTNLSSNSGLLSPALTAAPTILATSALDEIHPEVSAPVVTEAAVPAPPRAAPTASVRDPGRPDSAVFSTRRDT